MTKEINQSEERIAKAAAKAVIAEIEENSENAKIYYVNQVAKMLGMSHRTVKKKCRGGYIKTTKDGMITRKALNEYLNQ